MSDELKACPFCKSKDLEVENVAYEHVILSGPHKEGCFLQGGKWHFKTEEEAVSIFNRRTF